MVSIARAKLLTCRSSVHRSQKCTFSSKPRPIPAVYYCKKRKLPRSTSAKKEIETCTSHSNAALRRPVSLTSVRSLFQWCSVSRRLSAQVTPVPFKSLTGVRRCLHPARATTKTTTILSHRCLQRNRSRTCSVTSPLCEQHHSAPGLKLLLLHSERQACHLSTTQVSMLK